ncbi:MAG: dephospho-CoA kinase [Paracoccaceae bacterium]
MSRRAPFLIGLTGSIGMGKSTTAQMFADAGIPVWNADAAVARLYQAGGGAAQKIATIQPGAVVKGAVDKEKLRDWIAKDDAALDQIEAVIHPLVAADREKFLNSVTDDIALLDIPLLFETGGHTAMDLVVVVSVPAAVQRKRVLKRPAMTVAQFETILSRQMPDAGKRAKADVIMLTETLEYTRNAVQNLIADIRGKLRHA